MRNKTFFYANYEGLRQRLDGTQIGLVPSPSFLAQTALTSPALLPILSAYPLGRRRRLNPNVWNYVAPGRQIDNEDSGMIRVDQHFSDQNTAFLRFNSDEAAEQTPTGASTAKTGIDTKFNNGVAEFVHVFAPTPGERPKVWVESDHLSHRQSLPRSVWRERFRIQSLLPAASTTDYPSKSFDLIDDVAWAKGKHTIKFGFEIRWVLLEPRYVPEWDIDLYFTNQFPEQRPGNCFLHCDTSAGETTENSVLGLCSGRVEGDT